jgi:hypothetical protein
MNLYGKRFSGSGVFHNASNQAVTGRAGSGERHGGYDSTVVKLDNSACRTP